MEINKAEQYYPTYKSQERDVLLLEFQEAQSIANSQTKVYSQVSNILLASITILIPLFFGIDKDTSSQFLYFFNSHSLIFAIIIVVFGALLLRYFVELQKQITINARKVITLRTMLGLDYGSIHLTLPSWRVEGANNPFNINFFNGWLSFQSAPFWVLIIGVNFIWHLSVSTISIYQLDIPELFYIYLHPIYGNVIISASYLYIFRSLLNDRHETNYLNIIRLIAKCMNLKLLPNFEYILYRAKLSYIELDRLNINYDHLKKILIEIEDKSFSSHKGFSIKSFIRGMLSQSSFFRKKLNLIESGGSTITMQLVRSLFIPFNQNKYKRKIFEILLTYWINNQFSKDEILKLYISSVRYERGVIGLSAAIKYFFNELRDKHLSNEESFLLAERLSNITSTVRWDRINHLVTRINIDINLEELKNLYQKQIDNNILKKYNT